MKKFKSFIEGSKEEYKKFFDAKLKKYDVKSPAELSDADKKKFYDEIDAEWESDSEEDGDKEKGESVQEYIKHDGTKRRCAGGDGRRRAVKAKRALETEEDECDEDDLEEGKDGFLRLTFKSPADVKKAMKLADTEFGKRHFIMDKARTRPELDLEGDSDDLKSLKDVLKDAQINFKVDLEEQNLNEAMYSDKQINKACKKMKMSPAEVGEFYSYLEGK
mgnify:CR=1 FL=1|tara:strand:+ start:1239 stop:1895 length:657 start_codon:yes stop_codon:yes gene_type:complete